jgi:hypothetical protein
LGLLNENSHVKINYVHVRFEVTKRTCRIHNDCKVSGAAKVQSYPLPAVWLGLPVSGVINTEIWRRTRGPRHDVGLLRHRGRRRRKTRRRKKKTKEGKKEEKMGEEEKKKEDEEESEDLRFRRPCGLWSYGL